MIDVARRPDIGVVVERIRDRVEITGADVTADDIIAWRDGDRR